MKKKQENTKQEKVQSHNYYDYIAKGYNELHEEEQKTKLETIKKQIKTRKNQELLDIGFGTGFSTNFFDCNITGLEPSKKMLDVAKQKIKKTKQNNKITLIQKNDEHLKNFGEQKFDYVLCITVAHHFKNLDEAITQIKRITKKKGTIIFSLLKTSKTTKTLEKQLTNNFALTKKINQKKDIILILKQKQQKQSKTNQTKTK